MSALHRYVRYQARSKSAKGLDNKCGIARIDQNVMKSTSLSYSQDLPETGELIHSDLGKFLEEDALKLYLLYVTKQDFHPDEAGAPDQKSISFN